MKNDLISVVVPIYNVENYLKECVESILNQDYSRIEVILVDDGSTDNSGKLADLIKKEDKRIKVIHKVNGGLSDARNCGIKAASGRYICFIDSDDIIKCDYVSSLYSSLLKYNVKISSCGFCHLYENGETKEINFQNIDKVFSGDEAQIYLNVIGYYNVSACNKMFDISLFENIEFPKGKKSEDWFVMYKLIEKSQRIYYNSDTKYIYRQRAGSITKNSKANIDCIEASKEVYNYFKNNETVLPYATQSYAFALIGVYNFELCKGKKYSEIKQYREMVNSVKNELSYNLLPLKRKVQLKLFLNSAILYNIMFKFFDFYRKKRNN